MHNSVLLHESVLGLALEEGSVAIDATLGLGGHAEALCEAVGPEGVVLGIDADTDAIAQARTRLKEATCNIRFHQGNFRDIERIARIEGIDAPQGILFDLGWNSTQLSAGRGFSFNTDDPLLMTLEASPKEGTITAGVIVNTWSEQDLEEIIRHLGEERFAGRIAHAIIARRKVGDIQTARELAEVIESGVPPWYRSGRIHPATKTFQALRIVVNDELSSFKQGLVDAFTLLARGGRIAVISFHSIEDGIVKRTFKALAQEKKGVLIEKKPIRPRREEVQTNPRARSAKLRIIEKL